ncbi:MAG: hypothetical protein AAGU11_02270 [Syntrophobacteraceae bacterium]
MEKPEICICGYELNNPDYSIFEAKVVEVHGPCNECEFLGRCLTPCQSVRCLTPRQGQLVNLGLEAKSGTKVSYFAVVHEDFTSYYQLDEPDHWWARASCINEEQVPNWALSRLNGSGE